MLNTIKQRKDEGFTIIEVMIVLAIAGLIMVIVFLAVPALQRNSRNTALNTDANNILSAVGEYSSNNGGTLPTSATLASGNGSVDIKGPSGSNTASTKLGGSVQAVKVDDGTSPIDSSSALGTVEIVTGTKAKCNPTSTGLAGAAGARSYAVLYVAESASNNVVKCIGA